MLDITRLSSNQLLIQYGWSPSYKVNIEEYYRLTYHDGYSLQLSIEELFPAVKDIIESLEGIVIGNLHPSLKLGYCDTIEFSFFNYDEYNVPELLSIQKNIGKRVAFIGIGYDIIGDWLVDEEGLIYFRNKIQNRLHIISKDIYQFLEHDIYKLTDINGKEFL